MDGVVVRISAHPRSLVTSRSAGPHPVQVELSDGATVADLLATLDIPRTVVVAVNGRAVTDRSARLGSGDDVVLVMPISGG